MTDYKIENNTVKVFNHTGSIDNNNYTYSPLGDYHTEQHK